MSQVISKLHPDGLNSTFVNATQAAESLRKLGLHWDVVQLTSGPMQGQISVRKSRHFAVMSLECDQSLFVCGERNKSYVGVCFDSSLSACNHLIRGQPIIPSSIYGYNENFSDVFFKTDAGCRIRFVMFDRKRVIALSALESGSHLVNALSTSNSAQLDLELFNNLRRHVKLVSSYESKYCVDLNGELLEASLLEFFAPKCQTRLHSLKSENFRIGLMKDLVKWGLQNPNEVITLAHLSKFLFASRTTISHSCREIFGLGPMAFLKQIRLQQVQSALSSKEFQDQLGLNKIQDIACYYGFQSRNHFARDYRISFGESPRQTMSRANC